MLPAFMAEKLKNAEHLQIIGTEIDYLASLRWVRKGHGCRLLLMPLHSYLLRSSTPRITWP